MVAANARRVGQAAQPRARYHELSRCGDSAAPGALLLRASPAAGIEKRIGELINVQRAAVGLNGGGRPRKAGLN